MLDPTLSRRSSLDGQLRSATKQGLIYLIAAVHSICGVVVFARETSEDLCFLAPLVGHNSALSIEPVYTGEVFNNARGGITTKDATQYQALLELGVTVDFDATDLSAPGKFVVLAQTTPRTRAHRRLRGRHPSAQQHRLFR